MINTLATSADARWSYLAQTPEIVVPGHGLASIAAKDRLGRLYQVNTRPNGARRLEELLHGGAGIQPCPDQQADWFHAQLNADQIAIVAISRWGGAGRPAAVREVQQIHRPASWPTHG